MSTLMEDRLAAALRARAGQVRPEDLRPLDVPAAGMRRSRRRTAVVAGLAAAAVAAAVAGPLLLGGQDGTGSPQPSGPTEPGPTGSPAPPLGEVTADVDGDGRDDRARLVEEAVATLLVVDLASGDRGVARVPAGVPGTVLTAGDLGSGPGAELVVPVSNRPHDLPVVYTWLDAAGLVEATYPDSGVEGWRADVPQNRWTVRENGLRTWEAESIPGDGRYPYWDWSVDGRARLRPGPVRLGCASPEDAPAPCRGGAEDGKGEPDPGPRGDLPVLMPAVTEVLRGERYFYGRGPAQGDYAQLQGDLGDPEGAMEAGQVELVVSLGGEEHRAPVPAGQSPWLVPQTLSLRGDAPAFLLVRSGGDTSVVEVFSFRNGELVEVEPTGDVFLGSGVVDYRGELTEQRTWITPEGTMFTAILLDWETRRHHLWRWDDNVGETISAIDLGEACIDWESGEYGRCP